MDIQPATNKQLQYLRDLCRTTDHDGRIPRRALEHYLGRKIEELTQAEVEDLIARLGNQGINQGDKGDLYRKIVDKTGRRPEEFDRGNPLWE